MSPVSKLEKLFINDKKQAIKLAVPILIIIFYFSLFLLPKIKQISLLLPQVAQVKANIINTEKEWKNIDSLKKKVSNLSKKIDFYEKKLPSKKEIPAILGYLSSSASKLKVRITEIKPIEQEEDSTQIYYSIPILLKAECGYHQLGRFLNELEKADRFMKISDIKIEANPFKTNILSIQLTIVTYVMGQR